MKPFRWAVLLVMSAALMALPRPASCADESRTTYDKCVVGLNVTFQTWDEDRPWIKKKPETLRASAVLVDARHILTTAELLVNATYLQVETYGRARDMGPRIERVDRSANLALLAIDRAAEAGLEPVAVGERTPTSGTLRTVRWRGQQLEAAASRVMRFEVERSAISQTNHAFLRMRTDLSAGGWAEPVFDGGALVGVTVSQSGDESRAIPAEILKIFLQGDSASGPAESLTTLGVNWQLNRDTAVSRFLRLTSEPRGFLIRQVPWGSTACGVLKPRDILLDLGGERIDAEGFYQHPWLGRLGFNHMLAERSRPGSQVSARVLRDGEEREVSMTARSYPAALSLVPSYREGPPPYFILGGLIIRELDVPYLRTWGKEWSKDAPDPLLSRYYYAAEAQTRERRRVVLISSVLPSTYNVGYHDLRDVVIERINGRSIGRIEDVFEAVKGPLDGFQVIELARESPRDEIVLDSATLEAATAEILKSYGVPSALRARAEPLPDGEGECSGDY